ncbi:MAG TPA: DoxX-like family protein [Chlorobaculum sp.]|nr:DoxX-like family protein [Chlorobaculum sp.]
MNPFSRQAPALFICRIVLAFAWIYQGLVPKLVCKSPGEVSLLAPVAPVFQLACTLITYMGYGEIVFGLAILVLAKRWMFQLNIVALVVLSVYVAIVEPVMFTLPFNPLTLNAALVALSLIALQELNKNEK